MVVQTKKNKKKIKKIWIYNNKFKRYCKIKINKLKEKIIIYKLIIINNYKIYNKQIINIKIKKKKSL